MRKIAIILAIAIIFQPWPVFGQVEPTPSPALLTAHALYNQGQYPEAASALGEYLANHRTDAEAFGLRGACWEAMGRLENALRDYEQVVQLRPRQPEAVFNKALALYQLKRYTLALQDFEMLKELPVVETQAVYFKSSGTSQDGSFSEVMSMTQQQADIDNYIGLCHYHLGQLETAITYFTQALESHPQANFLTNRGLCYLHKKEYTLARNDFIAALKIDPAHAAAAYNLSLVSRGQQDVQSALSALNKAIEADERFPSAYANRGVAKMELGNYKGALADFDTAIQLGGKESMFFYNRALANEKIGKYPQAFADYQAALDLDERNAKAYRSRAALHVKLKQFKDALLDYHSAILIDPTHPGGYYNRGIVHHELGNNQAACADMRAALRLGMAEAKKPIAAWCK